MTRASFSTAFRDRPAARILRYARRWGKAEALIPNWAALLPGDIILSSKKYDSKSKEFKDRVRAAQLAEGYPPSIARFTHAMIYVGDLHVAESQTFFFEREQIVATGNRIVPLTLYARSHDLVVARIPDIPADVRDKIAFDALMNIAIDRKDYDFGRALLDSTDWVRKHVRPLIPERFRQAKAEAAICTDFVITCHVRRGLLVQEQVKIMNDPDYFYFPAEFVASSRFQKINLPSDRAVELNH